MCLGFTLLPRNQEKIKKEAKGRGYIRVWKAVGSRPKSFWCSWTNSSYKKGIQKAQKHGWDIGWHAFRDRKSAERWGHENQAIIECLALPEWIKNSGRDDSLKTILFTKLCFPEFPKRKVTIKEFRQYLKEK